MDGRTDLTEAMLAAPLGVTLLARLELGNRINRMIGGADPTTSAGVQQAADSLSSMSFGHFLNVVLRSADDAGPWNPDAPQTVADAYNDAEARGPIAEAITSRFGERLEQPLDRRAQEWWSASPAPDATWPLFRHLDSPYGAGQFTWGGLRTHATPPPEVHEELAWAKEISPPTITRFSIPARPSAVVFEIHRPADWVDLVQRYPKPWTGAPQQHWELPSVRAHDAEVCELLDVPGQNAARSSVRSHVAPDWDAVARDHDGVHLSWAGLITSEGFVNDLGDGDVAMLRYWFTEQTLWLRDVFDEPRALAPVRLDVHSTDPPRPIPPIDVSDIRRMLG